MLNEQMGKYVMEHKCALVAKEEFLEIKYIIIEVESAKRFQDKYQHTCCCLMASILVDLLSPQKMKVRLGI